MRDMPGVRDLENLMLLHRPIRDEPPSGRVDYEVDAVSRRLFGIVEDDTLFEDLNEIEFHDDGSPEWQQDVEDRFHDHEAQYEVGDDLTDDEIVEVMLRHGIDFRDDRGNPLLSTKRLARAAEAAVKGLAGRMPDSKEAKAEAWGANIEREAQAFMSRRKK